jgi:2-polyprenyl-3-methyl-5-hydroxy-6-metoxy-1,4-benzoquinol methylase
MGDRGETLPSVTNLQDQQIKTRHETHCRLCGELGGFLYEKFQDRVFGTLGEWNLRKCPKAECGLVWLDPVLTEEYIGQAYKNYYTHNQPTPLAGLVNKAYWAVWKSYLRHRFGYTKGTGGAWTAMLWPLALLHPGGRAELDSASMYLPAPNAGARVLDVGCGSGVLLERMQSLGWNAEGLEIDIPAVEAARKRGVQVRAGTLHEQRYPTGHFDAVHMSQVIEHVHEPLEVLAECNRILKPGGKLVITTPNIESWGHKRFGGDWAYLDPPRHLCLFNRIALSTAATRQGFRVEQIATTARAVWVAGAMSGQIRRNGAIDMARFHKAGWLVYGLIYQLRERFALLRDADAGDDLLLIATKS